MFNQKYRKILVLGVLVLNLFFVSNPVFAADQNCDSSPDKYDQTCSEEYVQKLYEGTKSCSDSDIYCYCIDFSESEFEVYECEDYLSGDDEFISFTQFDGELNNLEADGYDDSITETDNARDYITRIINFALSFLGFVAVIGIMYCGAQYLLAGDDSGAAEKGKEGVKFIGIGLLIIMSSYAIVNTVLQAPTGEEGDLAGSDDSYDQSVDGSSDFNNDTKTDVVDDIDTVQESTSNLYGLYVKVLPPLLDQIENDFNLETEDGRDEAIDLLDFIIKSVDQYSSTYNTAVEFKDALENENNSAFVLPQILSVAYARIDDGTGAEDGDFESSSSGSGSSTNSNSENNKASSEPSGDYSTYIDSLRSSINLDYSTNMEKINSEYAKLENIFTALDETNEVRMKYDEVSTALNALESNATDEKFSLADDGLSELKSFVEKLEFVDVKLNASTLKCTAPCTVSFDSLGTTDPSGLTVINDQHEWDLDGDGIFNEAKAFSDNEDDSSCSEIGSNGSASSNVVCTYYESETYLVSLTVKSNDSTKYAPGQVSVKVIVEPPSSEVKLSATFSGATEEEKVTIYDYLNEPPSIDSTIDFSPEEAQSGITFDASESLGKSGQSISDFTFTFEDDEDSVIADNGKVTHYFPTDDSGEVKLATYDGLLTVKEGTLEDKYPFSIIIKNPDAEVTVDEPTEKVVGETWYFDASNSTVKGEITNYKWTVGGVEIANSADAIRVPWTATAPGSSQVTLTITASNNGEEPDDSVSTLITVNDIQPTSCFTYEVKNELEPSTYYFDASCSSSNDNTELAYEWNIETDDSNYEIIEQDLDAKSYDENGDSDFLNDSYLVLRFKKLGEYKVSLDAIKSESTLPEKPSDNFEQDISVENVMDINFDVYPVDSETTAANNETATDGAFVYSYESEPNNVVTLEYPVFGFDIESLYLSENPQIAENIDFEFNCDYGEGTFVAENDNKISWISDGKVDYICKFTEADTYSLKLKVDDYSISNEVKRKVYVVPDDQPFAIISVKKDDNDVVADESNTIYGNVTSKFEFDGASSRNSKGEPGGGLSYSWDLGNGIINTSNKVTITYDEVSQNAVPFVVKLKVTDKSNDDTVSETTLNVLIGNEKPQINSLVIDSITNYEGSTEMKAPLQLTMKANADDVDGEITQYLWAYIDSDNSAQGYVDSQITTNPTATFVLNNNGEAGEMKNYIFVLVVTDDDGNKSGTTNSILENLDCNSSLESETAKKDCRVNEPELAVENGDNESPISTFSLDKTSINVGEQIRFDAAASSDPDGEIEEYIWDFEGNGFYDNEPVETKSITHIFDKVNNEGVKVRLRVKDNSGATSDSEPITVYIDALTDPPEASFEIEKQDGLEIDFKNTSSPAEGSFEDAEGKSEELSLEKCKWDFDIDSNGDGNGIKDDDDESFDDEGDDPCEGGTFIYAKPGTYRVKLTVYDNVGSSDEVTNIVTVDSQDLEAFIKPYDENDDEIKQKTDKFYYIDASNDKINFKISALGGVAPYEYYIDTNIAINSNGDALADNDKDLKGKFEAKEEDEISFEFDKSLEDFTVKLVLTDSVNNKVTIQANLKIEAEELKAYLKSNPPASQADGKIHLQGSSADITFDTSSSGGIGEVEECFDFNTYYDDDGDKNAANDCEDTYSLKYESSWGKSRAQLTVTDEKGNKASSYLDIVFDSSTTVKTSSTLDVYFQPSDKYASSLSVSDGKIHFTKNPGSISFKYKATGGALPYTFCLDKNANFDSDGNSGKNDDCNYSYTVSDNNYHDSAVMDFYEEWGSIAVQMKVTDANKNTDKTSLQIVFDTEKSAFVSSNLLADLFNTPISLAIVILAITGFSGALYFIIKSKKN